MKSFLSKWGIYLLLACVAVVLSVETYWLYKNNVFQLQTANGYGDQPKVLVVRHFSSVLGRHFYLLYAYQGSASPSRGTMAWVEHTETLYSGKTVTATGQGCNAALQFNEQGDLIGIGTVDEDTLGPIQTFSPYRIVPGQVYKLLDVAHTNGADCIFKSSPKAANIDFAVYAVPKPYTF